ncbi:hypothetical protein [Rhodococcus sp. 14-2470-1a]|nr:hypothetical protein [Rhodococcus sp. 14-2470-1a]
MGTTNCAARTTVFQVDRGNSRKVTLRRPELNERFPGLLDLIANESP